MKVIIVLKILVLISITGCVYPGPWSKESYISETDSFYHAPPDKDEKLASYFIGEAFVTIAFRALNGTTHSGGSPYRVHFGILGDEEAYMSVKIHDVKIQMEGEKFYDFGFLFNKEFEQMPKGINTPPFEVSRLSGDCHGLVWFYTIPIEVATHRVKQITVELDIEVFTKTGALRKAIQQEFKYEIKKGFWSWIEI